LNIFNSGNWESWDGGHFTLGQTGLGNLNISTTGLLQKSSLKSTNITLGTNGGTGIASVSGINASMTATNQMKVGEGAGSLGQLTISNIGKVNVADSLFIGMGSQLDNKVTITGAASEMVLGSNFTSIGFGGGKGTLDVLSGGKVTNSGGSINIGDSAGSTGAINISGSGSQFISSGNSVMKVGNVGNGTVSLESGGKLSVGHLDVGSTNTGEGLMTVKGQGTRVDLWGPQFHYVGNHGQGILILQDGSELDCNGSPLGIGRSGIGYLHVTAGSRLLSGGGFLGVNSSSEGTVSVHGVGSQWNVEGSSMSIGLDGKGNLNVGTGGKVNLHEFTTPYLGFNSFGNGSLHVSGAGSEFNYGLERNLHVGRHGSGTLNISAAGAVNGGSATIAFGPSTTGSAIVQDAGSKWNLADSLFVGERGTGTLNIQNGGEVNAAQLQVGSTMGSQGQIHLSGNGSQLSIAQNASIGGSAGVDGGNGTLNINPGTTAAVGGHLSIWSQGAVNLNGGTLKLGSLNDQNG
jgi:T5SS/PEP-CTERM-associated repeat protein